MAKNSQKKAKTKQKLASKKHFILFRFLSHVLSSVSFKASQGGYNTSSTTGTNGYTKGPRSTGEGGAAHIQLTTNNLTALNNNQDGLKIQPGQLLSWNYILTWNIEPKLE